MLDKQKSEFIAIGLMSGTSLDGVDMACCRFFKANNRWHFEIDHAKTVVYNEQWLAKLEHARTLQVRDFIRLHNTYGVYLGNLVNEFVHENNIVQVDFVASHGHTILHEPEKSIGFQLGHGAYIHASCRLPVISDFRTLDIALGGQGAPLVPVGDRDLFPEYNACINLGGFSNISFYKHERLVAFDICPVNILLNRLAQEFGMKYDENGRLGTKGTLNKVLLQELNSLGFYEMLHPKSLGVEWVEKEMLPLINKYPNRINVIRTCYQHIVEQITQVLKDHRLKKVLFTGGGACNNFLMAELKRNAGIDINIGSEKLINYKEALVFAYLGLLKITGATNVERTVTGAYKSSVSGVVYV